jgi:transketolase
VSVDTVRRIILEQSKRANVGHIGCALSVADVIAAVYDYGLREPNSDPKDRDRFVLSKGHAALALFACLHVKGRLSREQLDTYCADNSLLGVHPEHALQGVDFSTGSLGQGLSMAAGAALAARLQGSSRRVYAVLSDAECNEGSVWEAAMFAAQHQLSNLTAVIDLNGQQAFGYTRNVLDLSNMADRWRAFHWDVHEVDGHDRSQLRDVLVNLDYGTGRPHLLVARTTFGKGISFMQSKIKWHYSPLSDSEYGDALREVGAQS